MWESTSVKMSKRTKTLVWLLYQLGQSRIAWGIRSTLCVSNPDHCLLFSIEISHRFFKNLGQNHAVFNPKNPFISNKFSYVFSDTPFAVQGTNPREKITGAKLSHQKLKKKRNVEKSLILGPLHSVWGALVI